MDLQKLKKQLTAHEGIKLMPYVDTVGKVTIGIGHNLSDVGITASVCDELLSFDIQVTVAFLSKMCPWWLTLDDVRQRAIADLTFNVQHKIMDFKNMIAAIEAKDWPRASAELLNSTFATQTGQRAKDLAKQLLTGSD